MKRRTFFKTLGGFTGGFLAGSGRHVFPSADSFGKAVAGLERDDRFWELVRDQFHFPPGYVYLNTAGLGSRPLVVVRRVREEMDSEDARPCAGHNLAHWWQIKEKCASLLGPGVKKEELALTGSASEGINIVLNGLDLQKGDEVITSTHEHVALNVPLLYKMKQRGIVVKTFEPDFKSAAGNTKRIEKLVGPRTRLVFISHVTCTTGQIMPVEEIGKLARSAGVFFALDGAQAIGQFPLDLPRIGVDFYAVSGHKWLLGPRRTGFLYVRQELLDRLSPSLVGAYSSDGYDLAKGELKLHPTAQRYEYGTQNDALFYGLSEAATFMNSIGLQTVYRHNKALAENFRGELRRLQGVEIIGPEEEKARSAIVTFRVKNTDNSKLSGRLHNRGIRVRQVDEASIEGVRVSFHIFNNPTEILQILERIKKI